MIKVTPIDLDYAEVIDSCLKSMQDVNSAKGKLKNDMPALLIEGNNYGILAKAQRLHELQISGKFSLSNNELVGLYKNQFTSNKEPKKIYSSILTSSGDRCPYCGGIGKPSTLDHYLPKEFYPVFSILPNNLVPACRDCNLGDKKDEIISVASGQLIHPYYDSSHFFTDNWITGKYIGELSCNDPGIIDYFVKPPSNWLDVDIERAQLHFNVFKIKSKYGKAASIEINNRISMINQFKSLNMGNANIISYLEAEVQRASFPNHWHVGLNQAFIDYLSEF